MIELWRFALVILGTLIGAFGALFLKLGSSHLSYSFKKLITNYSLFLGLFLYCLGTLPFIFALKGSQLSLLYPLVSASYIWVALLSALFLKEKMNKFKWLGILIIILGVTLIAFS